MAVKIFFCYAHQDEDMACKLRQHLKPLQRIGSIDIWYDHDICPGTEWGSEINKHLNEAQIILLLVSSGFMNSDYCYSIEMKQAIARHERGEAVVVPIILRPVYWHIAPIDKLQVLPKNAKPISSWIPQDKGYENVTNGICEVIQQWNAHNLSHPTEEKKRLLITLSQLIEAVKLQAQPAGRAAAIASTLQQLSTLIPHGVTLADILAGWLILSRRYEGEENAVVLRRNTCTQLAEITSQITNDQGNLTGAVKTWQAWLDAFKNSHDPRHATMARTFARELIELQEAASYAILEPCGHNEE